MGFLCLHLGLHVRHHLSLDLGLRRSLLHGLLRGGAGTGFPRPAYPVCPTCPDCPAEKRLQHGRVVYGRVSSSCAVRFDSAIDSTITTTRSKTSRTRTGTKTGIKTGARAGICTGIRGGITDDETTGHHLLVRALAGRRRPHRRGVALVRRDVRAADEELVRADVQALRWAGWVGGGVNGRGGL